PITPPPRALVGDAVRRVCSAQAGALAAQLGEQELRVHRAQQLAQRLHARLDDLKRALDVHLARQAAEQSAHLLGDQRLERFAVAQRVVHREAQRLLVAARAEARDRLDDLYVVGLIARARRRQYTDLRQALEHVGRDLIALAHLARRHAPVVLRARQRPLEDAVLEL